MPSSLFQPAQTICQIAVIDLATNKAQFALIESGRS